jgi:hypothetical protein
MDCNNRFAPKSEEPFDNLRVNGQSTAVRAETCMMDVEAHHESSITDTMAKILTIVSRRNFDGKPKVYS